MIHVPRKYSSVFCSTKYPYKMGSSMLWLGVFVVCFFGNSAVGQFQTVTYGGHTFSVSDDQLPWVDAVSACNANGQQLASIEDMEKDDILVQLFVEKLHTNVTMKGNSWISASEVTEGVWHWASLNKPTYYTRWFIGQPDDTENLNCVYMALNSLLYWRDANCSASMYFICEGQPTTLPPTSTDSTSSSTTILPPTSTDSTTISSSTSTDSSTNSTISSTSDSSIPTSSTTGTSGAGIVRFKTALSVCIFITFLKLIILTL